MKRKKILMLMACASAAMCFSGTAIYAMPQTSVTNHFSTGIVDISLREYQLGADGMEEAWVDNPTILPGTQISKIPRIKNDGNDCYVRARVSLKNTEGLTTDDLYGISDQWVRASDGYYYFKQILKTGDTVDLFKGINVPKDFPQEEEGQKISCIVDAEAIQSQNFTPDFQASSPWGDVKIEECKKEGMYDIASFKQGDTQSFLVEYQGDADKLISDPNDFFTNFPVILPGDSYSESAELSNDSDREINLYFRTEDIDDSELLDRITLSIDCTIDGKTEHVYDGSLRAVRLQDDILLGRMPAGSRGNFTFSIQVPKELDNAYTLLDGKVKWIFSTEKIEPDGTGGTARTGSVKTGDTQKTGFYLLLSGLGLAVATGIVGKTRKEDEKE